MTSQAEKPDWWRKNEILREKMSLPPYEPPRFLDGVYTHEITNNLERKYEIEILFIGRDTRYGDDWEITLNGDQIGSIGRHRDSNSNTIYELSSEEFCNIIESNFR